MNILDATQPLVKIIEQLAKRKDSNQVYIKQPGFTVRMEKRVTAKLGELLTSEFKRFERFERLERFEPPPHSGG